MRTKTTQQADKILDAAARLFGTQRFHEVRMDDIAAEAGVGKGTLYRYFNDKEELYLALLQRASQQFLDRLAKEREKPLGPREQLQAVVASIIFFFDAQPHLSDLIQRAEVLQGPGGKFPWQETRDELIHMLLDLFKEAKARGEFSVRDPEIMVLMLLGGLRSVIRYSDPPRARDLPRRIVDNFLSGVDLSQHKKSTTAPKPAFIPEPSRA